MLFERHITISKFQVVAAAAAAAVAERVSVHNGFVSKSYKVNIFLNKFQHDFVNL